MSKPFSRRARASVRRQSRLTFAPAPTVGAEMLEARWMLATFTVTNALDAGPGSLRQAIIDANANAPGTIDVISFNIGAGMRTITPSRSGSTTTTNGALPDITSPVVIDGSAPASFPTQVIELNGQFAPSGSNGFRITAGASTVRNLTINRFSGNGIELATGGNNVIEGCKIGTDVTGTTDLGNGDDGVDLNASSNNRIGGTTAAGRNLISGNNSDGVDIGPGSGSNQVLGNYIGVRASGTAALGNSGEGVRINGAGNNTIGGPASDARNVISGNGNTGVRISGTFATGNLVRFNYIGTDASGTADLGNGGDGVSILSASGEGLTGNVIGGPDMGNLISGNNDDGVDITGANAALNRVEGNTIGLAQGGNAALPNGTAGASGSGAGVEINGAHDNTIGGITAGAGNVISGNLDDGIHIEGTGANNNLIQGNRIGTNSGGTVAVGNGNDGVHIRGAFNTVGGTATTAPNVISGNADDGIEVQGSAATGNVIQGNYVGTDVTGTSAVGNGSDAVEIQGALNTQIGGTNAGARNVLAGNASDGIEVFADAGGPGTGTLIRANLIGVGVTGAPLGNTNHGVNLRSSDSTVGGTAAGASNVIANNGLAGVFVSDGSGNAILGNSIVANGTLGIDLAPADVGGVTSNDAGDPDAGPNLLQNCPVLSSAVTGGGGSGTTVAGTLNSTPGGTFRIEFFSSPAAPAGARQGRTFLGFTTATTDPSGNATFSVVVPVAVATGEPVSATATSTTAGSANNTSEFSAPVTATASAGLPAWLAPGSAATWNAAGKQLTVTGSATIIADPGSDLPLVTATGAAALLTISPGTSATVVHLGALNLSGGAVARLTAFGTPPQNAAARHTLVIETNGLTVTGPGSKLDLTDNAAVLRNTSLSTVQGLVTRGNDGGAWTGGGITSGVAAADPTGPLAVGYASAAQLAASSFQGVGGLSPGDALLRLTYDGDTNLNGLVNTDDILNILSAGKLDQGVPATWFEGDFTFDQRANTDDILAILSGGRLDAA
jgi:hypothetical protein